MTEANRINANFRGLTVHNQNNNILRMEQDGNFSLTTKNIENISYNRLVNVSEKESIYKSKNDVLLSSENGKIIIRNGSESNTPGYIFSNPTYDETNDTFFDTTNTDEIIKPFSSTTEVNNLRNDAFLIESLGSKSMCLYSNNGLNQVSHGNINLISDEDILVQTSKKLNLTSMGYILFNSERMISSIEEDIHFLSSTGEFKVGGNGLNTIGLKVNSNLYKNYLSLGRVDENADRNLHIDINEQSYDNTEKNGIIIDSKNINNGNTFPDIKLNNYDKSSVNNNSNILTTLNMGIGSDSLDVNNLIFVKKENVTVNEQTSTRIIALNDFTFTNTDINKTITYVDTTYGTDTIKSLVDGDLSKATITSINSDAENTSFDYQQAYINRDNHGHIKTKTSSDLHLGTNKNDILIIKNTGNIGINTSTPTASVQIENKFGKVNNIRIDKDKNYYNGKGIQMNNGNYIIFYNTFKNSLYNLEASIYTINNDLVSNFSILSGSSSFIEFDIDNLKGLEDKFVITYCYSNDVNYILQSKIYNNEGVKDNLDYTFTHTFLNENCFPKVKSFNVKANSATGEMYNGYILMYRDQLSEGGDINIYGSYFSNLSSSVIGTFNLITNLDTYISGNVTNFTSIISRNYKFIGMEYDNILTRNNRKLYVIPSGVIKIKLNDNSEVNYYFSLLNVINFSYNSTTLKPSVTTNNTFYSIRHSDISDNTRYEILGTNIKLRGSSGLYILSYYVRDNNDNKIDFVYRGNFDENNLGSGVTDITLIDSSLDETPSTLNYRKQIIPSIDIVNTSDYIISYTNGSNIKYHNSSISSSSLETLSGFSDISQGFNLRIQDNSNNFQSILLFWNNSNTSNNYYYNSINFKEIVSVSSFVNIKNENIDINVNNNGDINIQNIMDIKKSNNSTTFNNLLVSAFPTSAPVASDTGILGEIKYFGNNLYIYLDNGWNKVNLTVLS